MYAMDTHFMSSNQGPTPLEQVHMVKEAGYDDYYVTDAVTKYDRSLEIQSASNAAGLGLNAAFNNFNVSSAPTPEALQNLERVLAGLHAPTRFEISLLCGEFGEHTGDASKDGMALAWLKPIAALLETHGIQGSLYPHFGFYLETFTDALRLQEKVNSPNLNVIFCGYHFFRVGKEKSFADLFDQAGDRLNAVNLCGTQHLPDPAQEINGLNPTIEPLDAGTMDNRVIVKDLINRGYTGPIGIQGYGVNATPKDALQRSYQTLQSYFKSI
jgi:sugar phosphate isomerase/epimerase